MKKLGLIGGMGPESTIPYYHDIVYGVQQKLGTNAFPELTIESVNVFQVLRLCGEQKYKELTEYLLQAIHHLAAAGADFAALSANTPHIVFDELQRQSPLPLVSIVESTCREAKRQQLTKIGLIGTVFTMKGDFFKKPFLQNGIDVIIPAEQEMAYINDKISSELELGVVKEETLKEFQKIIERMKCEDCIQAIVLGCTELPLILNNQVSPVPCLDTMKIHIQDLVNWIVQTR